MLDILKKWFAPAQDDSLSDDLKEGAFLVDVRSPFEISAGSVKRAVNIPLDKISNQLEKFKGKKNIIVFCASGGRSGQAKNILERHGFINVTNGGTWRNVNKWKNG